MADYHISPTGNDANNGLTAGTAWKTLGKALTLAAGSRVFLYGGGIIANGATSFQKGIHFTTPANVHAQIKGSGKIGLDLQNWQGGSILPGTGGSITIIGGYSEPIGADGEKAGAVLGRGLSLYLCNDVQANVIIDAGTDYGLYLRDSLRCRITADVKNAGEGFHLQGNLGTGADRSWVGGIAHDCNRMIRNTKANTNDDYGATAFVFTRSIGGGLLAGWKAERCFAPSFDYKADGGGLVHDDATDSIVELGTITDCEGGYEDGGTQGGNHRNTVKVALRGSMGAGTAALNLAARSPGVLIRNNESATFDFDIDITRARVAFEMGADSGTFGGPIDNTKVTGKIVQRPNVPTGIPVGNLPATTTVNIAVVQPGTTDPCAAIKAERDAALAQLATANANLTAANTALGLANSAVTSLTAERDAATAKLAQAKALAGQITAL